ncbi:MAG TPA: di-heme oxidoredictase family protein [Blastocatellia bacterium]|nr:di-heme oxidoredictase family protein [Blastocatellia bacterium]
MRSLKLSAVLIFLTMVLIQLGPRGTVSGQGAAEAPTGFDNQTNGMVDQATHDQDRAAFEEQEQIADGLGPTFNGQACAECHRNPVTGTISQVNEMRAGHVDPFGVFISAPGGSVIQDNAINARIQETIPPPSKLVFASTRDGNGEIYVMNPDGTGQTNITNHANHDTEPSLSPDGSQVVFVSHRDGNAELYKMSRNGTNLVRLTNIILPDQQPKWSPNNDKIAFARHVSGTFQVFTMDTSGGAVTQLTSLGVNSQPAWSPDGQKIAFISNRDGNFEIYVMNANGSSQTRLTNNPALDQLPAWSPSGQSIAFATNRDGNEEIYVMKSDGTGQTRLTNNSSVDTQPSFSVDGTQIAFHSDRDGNQNIFVMDFDGALQTRLTTAAGADLMADWRGDGNQPVQTFRASLNAFGDGFVEAIDDQTLINISNSQPLNMRGQVNVVPVLEAPGSTRVARFSWKNSIASLIHFSAAAYITELGITSPLQPNENSSLGRSVSAFDTVPDPEDTGGAQGFGQDVEAFARFMRATKAPPRGPGAETSATPDPAIVRGSTLFDSIGCAICHVRTIVTAPSGTPINGGTFIIPPALGNKTIHPFGDFLLHDIGTGDGIVETAPSTANKMRTPPLWGVRTRTRLMHDAQSLTFLDAILRHANEAASTRTAFQALSEADKRSVILFLKSL